MDTIAIAIAKKNKPTMAQVNSAVNAWLDDHPEATTTVEDGSITKVKLDTSLQDALSPMEKASRVSSLTDTPLASGEIVDCVGIPIYLSDDDLSDYSAYGLTESGWYALARIMKQSGTVGQDASVTGAAGYVFGEDRVDVAVKFEVAAQSQAVTVTWTAGDAETFVFRATDLAVRNLDYRTTFYVYDLAPYTTWTYALTTDATFTAGKNYYTETGGVYTLAEVTAGEAVPANTYYNHSKLTLSGMVKNVTYRLDEPLDCALEVVLPEIEDDGHGAWFEFQLRHTGSLSITLTPPTGVKGSTAGASAAITAGLNVVDLHYTDVDGVKMWSLANVHTNIPA